jgi:hypothetical protein
VEYQLTGPEGLGHVFHRIFWWVSFKVVESYQRGVLLLQCHPRVLQRGAVPRTVCKELRPKLYLLLSSKDPSPKVAFSMFKRSDCGLAFHFCEVDQLWTDVRHGVQKE